MPKIVNERYKEFIDKGSIELFTLEELDKALINAGRSKYTKMARAFLIVLYYTGARPVELLQLKPHNFAKKKSYLTIQIPTAKRGVPRIISIPFARKYVTELWQYASSLFDEIYIFYSLASSRTRNYVAKKGEIKQYTIITDRIYYYIKSWVGINPYFFRHSRMSALSQNGAGLIELQHFKGSVRTDSVMPYLHMSSQISEKIGRKLK